VDSIRRELLNWPESSFGGDVAIHITGFGVMLEFITEPTPPGVPSHIDSICSEAEVVHHASAIVVL
jgi:hypothetical protein